MPSSCFLPILRTSLLRTPPATGRHRATRARSATAHRADENPGLPPTKLSAPISASAVSSDFCNSGTRNFKSSIERNISHFALSHDFAAGFFAQAFDVAQPEPHDKFVSNLFQRAQPIRLRHIDRPHAQAVPLRVFHQRRRMIKSHGLIIEHRRGKRGEIVAFQIRAGIRDQRKTRRMRFGKSIQRERRDRLHDRVLRRCR